MAYENYRVDTSALPPEERERACHILNGYSFGGIVNTPECYSFDAVIDPAALQLLPDGCTWRRIV